MEVVCASWYLNVIHLFTNYSIKRINIMFNSIFNVMFYTVSVVVTLHGAPSDPLCQATSDGNVNCHVYETQTPGTMP